MTIAPALYTSARQEWLTPPHIIEAVLATLGTIDLDPCSNSDGPPNVPATYHYTAVDNGLAHPWAGRVFTDLCRECDGVFTCQCDCHKVTPSTARGVPYNSHAQPNISIPAPTDHADFPLSVKTAQGRLTGSVSHLNSGHLCQPCSDARAVLYCTQHPETTSGHFPGNEMDSHLGALCACESTHANDKQYAAQIPPNAQNFLQKSNATANHPEDGQQNVNNPPSTTYGGNVEQNTLPGIGVQHNGISAKQHGATCVPIAAMHQEIPPKITLSPLATPHALAPSQEICSPPAPHVTPPKEIETPINGAGTRAPSIALNSIYNHCANCAGCTEIATPSRVFVNPPYDDTLIWVKRLIHGYNLGEVREAVLLVPARTDTKWFQLLAPYPVCFIRGRLRFSGSTNSAPFPSAVFYLGIWTQQFIDTFGAFGPIYEAVGT